MGYSPISINGNTINTNDYFDFDAYPMTSVSSPDYQKSQTPDPIDTLLELKADEISMNQIAALNQAMSDLKSHISPAQPGVDQRR